MKFVKIFLVLALVVFLTLEFSEAGSKKDKQGKDKYNKSEKRNKDEKYNKEGKPNKNDKNKKEKYNREEKNKKYNDKQNKRQEKQEEVLVEEEAPEDVVEEIIVDAVEQIDSTEQEQLKVTAEELRRQNEELARQNLELKQQKEKLQRQVLVQLSHGGEVQGTTLISHKRRRFFAFRGIPYAEPPLADLRFKAPVAKAPWAAGTPLDATKDGPICPQVNGITNKVEGQEDCLILNVYTPELPEPEEEDEEDESLPVLVWIHGGGFGMGSSHSAFYNPKFFMDQRVVLVTVNYRLGAFGFLSTADAASPGNYGLLDQSLALQWVKENIGEFSGDPSRVTIFGESAGGASVGYHMLSPASTRLFHGAIAMSGSPLCQWALSEPHQVSYWANKLATTVGCPNATSDELITCLRGIPASTIVETTVSFAKYGILYPLAFVPTVDGQFLKEDPLTILSSGKIPNRVPVIQGITSKEGLSLLEMTLKGSQNPDYSDKALVTDLTNYMIDTLGQQTEAANLIYETYYSSIDKTDPASAKNALIDIFSNGMIDTCHYQTVELLTKATIPTYVYSYNYQSLALDVIGLIYNVDKTLGVGHGGELGALFRLEIPGLPVTTLTPEDETFVSNFTTLFTNFAARGNPTPLTRRNKFAVEWLQTEETPITIFNIDSVATISTYDPATDPIYDLWTKQVPELEQRTQSQENKSVKEEL